MIQIKKDHYIGEGLARTCYCIPDDNHLCVKIGKPDVEVSHLYKEINYYKKIKHNDISKFDYPFYAKYHGEVETNLGTGFVYDLIRDETTQNISLTLRQYLQMEDSPFPDSVFIKGLNRLRHQMIKHKVFVGDLKARNVCVKVLKNNTVELIVVDGLGHRDFFPLADWFHYFAKKKVSRRFLKAKFHSLSALKESFE
ncbi:YrbL family protein [uncultured Algibacter sp.]|uniref:YrbL family protein n=1 Tax=uncultured Algibacter sp. TaxID=298659 RepID=UPI003216AC58